MKCMKISYPQIYHGVAAGHNSHGRAITLRFVCFDWTAVVASLDLDSERWKCFRNRSPIKSSLKIKIR